MRLVIDTNVLVYALLRKGIPGRQINFAPFVIIVLTQHHPGPFDFQNQPDPGPYDPMKQVRT
jgi:hypothetical protein